jgi:hypothetical protein
VDVHSSTKVTFESVVQKNAIGFGINAFATLSTTPEVYLYYVDFDGNDITSLRGGNNVTVLSSSFAYNGTGAFEIAGANGVVAYNLFENNHIEFPYCHDGGQLVLPATSDDAYIVQNQIYGPGTSPTFIYNCSNMPGGANKKIGGIESYGDGATFENNCISFNSGGGALIIGYGFTWSGVNNAWGSSSYPKCYVQNNGGYGIDLPYGFSGTFFDTRSRNNALYGVGINSASPIPVSVGGTKCLTGNGIGESNTSLFAGLTQNCP